MRVVLVVDLIRDESGFVRRIADAAAAGMASAAHDVDVVDLAGQQFSPVMTAADRRAYFSPEPLVCPQAAASADLVRRADALVFVYPTVLSTVTPGIKGWIERTFVPGVAFSLGDPVVARGGLSGIRRLVGISVYDDSRRDVRRVGDNGRRVLQRNVRLCGGLRTRSSWIAFHGNATAGDAERERFVGTVERRMASL
jgi:putative NADPH-quinone reductase